MGQLIVALGCAVAGGATVARLASRAPTVGAFALGAIVVTVTAVVPELLRAPVFPPPWFWHVLRVLVIPAVFTGILVAVPGMRRSTASLARAILIAAVLASGAAESAAQPVGGTIEGIARADDGGAAIPFALVRLSPADSPSVAAVVALRQRIADAEGRFRFADVAAGAYRVQLLRIGYRPVLSPVLRLGLGETLRHELRGATQAVALPPVSVQGDGRCHRGSQRADDLRVAALWEEARKGVETRRAFALQYRFTHALRQDIVTRVPGRAERRRVRGDTTVSEPDSALARSQRSGASRREVGYGTGNQILVPSDLESFDESFLRDHCLEAAGEDGERGVGLRFRLAASPRGRHGFRGTIWLDPATYLMRRLDGEFLDGDAPFGRVANEYGDVPVCGHVLRLPVGGSSALRPLRAPRGTTVEATLAFAYWDVHPFGAR